MSDSPDTGPSADSLASEVQAAVARMYRRARSEMPDNELGETPLSVLSHLVKHGPQSLRSLSERERVTPPAMSQVVNALQASGLVTRSPDPGDGRRVLVAATGAGASLWIDGRRARDAWMNARLAELSADQRRAVSEAARILRAMADS
ncbi:MAG: MarR family transcriptional regulator [Pseudonocardiales bacterium]|nr:MarR family transcriptional regulator [Pseudonocardiales bacterium]